MIAAILEAKSIVQTISSDTPGSMRPFQRVMNGVSEHDKLVVADRFSLQGSILDMVRGDADRLERKLNQQDRIKLDEYLTSVRDVEKRIGLRRNWLDIPKPEAPFAAPKNRSMVEDLPLLYDLIALALQTDSTRIATLISAATSIPETWA